MSLRKTNKKCAGRLLSPLNSRDATCIIVTPAHLSTFAFFITCSHGPRGPNQQRLPQQPGSSGSEVVKVLCARHQLLLSLPGTWGSPFTGNVKVQVTQSGYDNCFFFLLLLYIVAVGNQTDVGEFDLSEFSLIAVHCIPNQTQIALLLP